MTWIKKTFCFLLVLLLGMFLGHMVGVHGKNCPWIKSKCPFANNVVEGKKTEIHLYHHFVNEE